MIQKTKKYGITHELGKFSSKGQKAKRQEIIETCKVTKVTLSKWENLELGDEQQIGVDHIAAMARVLGCEIEDLMSAKGFIGQV